MKRVHFALASFAAMLAAPAMADDYTCSDFVSELSSIPDEGEMPETLSPEFMVSSGMIAGVFSATQKSPFNDINDKALSNFERQVAAMCSEAPEKTVAAAALVAAGIINEPSEYTPLSLTDFNLDKSGIVGRKVSLTGDLSMFGDYAMLRSGMMDTNPISIDTDGLSRDDRKFILENCNMRCKITVKGTVTDYLVDQGLKAEAIIRE